MQQVDEHYRLITGRGKFNVLLQLAASIQACDIQSHLRVVNDHINMQRQESKSKEISHVEGRIEVALFLKPDGGHLRHTL